MLTNESCVDSRTHKPYYWDSLLFIGFKIKERDLVMETYYKAINWNAIEDVIDKSTWEN